MTVTLDLDAAATDPHVRRTLADISLSVAKGKKIVVVTGAGISCSCGIPDFRSSDGLYAMVKEQYPDVVMKGRDLFDAALFRDPTSTAVFYTFISQLKRSIDDAEPAPTHHFIKTLDSKKKLLRSYTQNIDGLEARVGLLGTSCQEAKSNSKGKTKIRTKDVRNVQLHGDIHRVRCVACSADYPCSEEHLILFERGKAPECPECLSRSEARIARSARAIRVGSLRPSIVLYDETHPLGDDIGTIHTTDLGRKPDMLIIMGTSMKVHGLKKLVKDFARAVHSSSSPSAASSSKRPYKVIFVNKTAPSSEWADIIDYHISGETDRWTNKVIEDWKKMRPADWEIQQTLDGDGEIAVGGGLKTVKSLASSTLAKNGKAGRERENMAPPTVAPATKESVTKGKPIPPLSPSKRRQKSSHYDDLESSPSKRHSTSRQHHVMPSGERKMLFAETTNKQPPLLLDSEKSKMDISLCDLSMQDVELKYPPKSNPKSSTGKHSEVGTSKMDISLIDLSMAEGEIIPAKRLPVKPTRKDSKKSQDSQRRSATKRPVRQRSLTQPQELEGH
ncbi:hypothetical protein M413DRAFT_209505 [Hebeloma cylindrosporum]|uniref:Deacetylase sirtuin-type domain-containing protein n=1 Tax=Hebeloma cylindrosporum TaxID=76867 RepID=A0A0C3CVB3_HEBCY|nr:hypothetical protein M413DRAFT_209505 [Hebeloma cylindrosporum h7]